MGKNKLTLIEAISKTAETTGYSKKGVEEVIKTFLNVVLDSLQIEGKSVIFRGLLKMTPHEVKGYAIKNNNYKKSGRIIVAKHTRYSLKITRK